MTVPSLNEVGRLDEKTARQFSLDRGFQMLDVLDSKFADH
jgi:hypothetical protein